MADTSTPSLAQSLRRAANQVLRATLFLTFTLAGIALFALATLLPMLREEARLQAERRALQKEVQRLEQRLADLEEFAAAISDDALTNERLAKIDLAYQRPGEEIVAVEPAGLDRQAIPRANMDDPRTASIIPDHWPDMARAGELWLIDQGLLDGFLNPPMRTTWLLLSAGMVVAALVIFAPRRRSRAPLRQQTPAVSECA